jgi:uncharacterized Zn finger protein
MQPIREIINEELVTELASRSHLRYGKEILKSGEIKFTKTNTFNIHAEVLYKNRESRRVDLMSTTKGFRWKCDCSSKKDSFCEHCIAVSLKVIEPKQPTEE